MNLSDDYATQNNKQNLFVAKLHKTNNSAKKKQKKWSINFSPDAEHWNGFFFCLVFIPSLDRWVEPNIQYWLLQSVNKCIKIAWGRTVVRPIHHSFSAVFFTRVTATIPFMHFNHLKTFFIFKNLISIMLDNNLCLFAKSGFSYVDTANCTPFSIWIQFNGMDTWMKTNILFCHFSLRAQNGRNEKKKIDDLNG